ncbi:MAG: metallophosphoesterase [Ruminococcus sp.]|nr:metallophosphoesterase [Ruminococcus sp.]
MIYITGDTHGGVDMRKLSRKALKRYHIELTENDFLIVTGDFGFPFTPEDITEYESGEKTEYTTWMKWFSERPYKVLFVDGNHDNHDWWSRQPVTELFGGRVQVHPHAENVIHLMRGEIYEIEGKTFFTFGGAASVDKEWRTEGYSWWSGEEATYAETEHAHDNLERVGYKVDYIITHTMPQNVTATIPRFNHKLLPCATAMFLNTVLETVQYDKWFCGHFHIDEVVPFKRLFVLYETVHKLDDFDKILNDGATLYTVF